MRAVFKDLSPRRRASSYGTPLTFSDSDDDSLLWHNSIDASTPSLRTIAEQYITAFETISVSSPALQRKEKCLSAVLRPSHSCYSWYLKGRCRRPCSKLVLVVRTIVRRREVRWWWSIDSTMSCLTFNSILNVYATTEFREKITLSCVIAHLGHRASSRNLGLIILLLSARARKGKPPLLRRFKLPYRQ